MSTGAKLSCTTQLQKYDDTQAYVTVAEITGVSGFGASAAQVDVSNMDSAGSKEFIAGLKEGSEFSFTGNSTGSATQSGLLVDLQAGTKRNWKIIWPTGLGTDTFAGILTKFDITADAASAVKFTASVKISGAITHA
jgi:hypothetical protein